MDVFGAVVAHGLQVEVLQKVQSLLEHRALGPGVMSEDLVALEGRGDRLSELALVVGQVFHG